MLRAFLRRSFRQRFAPQGLWETCGYMSFAAASFATLVFSEYGCRQDMTIARTRARRYPVLYLNDGQNLFESATSFTGVEWQVDETADRLIREGKIAPTIFVGIDNAAKDRLREYMPYRSLHPMMMRVQGRRYPDFLMKEVLPFVSRNYRIAVGPENTRLGGSSLGALIADFIAWRHGREWLEDCCWRARLCGRHTGS